MTTPEPDCTACCDDGFVDDPTGETGIANCYDCNPTPEQAAAAHEELRRQIAAEGNLTTEPF